MSTLPPIVSTLAATDLVPAKPATTIGAPNPVIGTGKILNDARLLSRAGAELQFANSFLQQTPRSGGSNAPVTSSHTALSVAASAISAILSTSDGIKSLVITGRHALLSLANGGRLLPISSDATGKPSVAPTTVSDSSIVPGASQTAAAFSTALMRVVTHSGLFYESHLLQYAFGRRPLAQILLEPQARLGSLAQRFPELFSEHPSDETPEWLLARSAVLAQLSKSMSLPVMMRTNAVAGDDSESEIHAQDQNATDLSDGESAQQISRHVADKLSSTYAAANIGIKNVELLQASSVDGHPDIDATDASLSSSAFVFGQKNGAEMSADLMAMVRHQLEILATPLFRWQGEAWPGAAMEWEFERTDDAGQDQQKKTAQDEAITHWRSRIKMTLPLLGPVELRIDIRDNNVQTYLYAQQENTVAVMRTALDHLRQRFNAGEVNLRTLELGTLPVDQ
ncbi:flagellar hook-length control protein FliK [Glaciimonas soli]|uniref:Flagellar hook-length control protein-like C-terminal domain-containing protein n=1 Tax=Glaciimonas soli TaxID=2590999 RepID=A0A843YJ86_9BURK|nr:flagellar hook-length control protein FliK [Glaciimonas soli]MQQ99434.1 hypothetical protein [Glaciimonas soli]